MDKVDSILYSVEGIFMPNDNATSGFSLMDQKIYAAHLY